MRTRQAVGAIVTYKHRFLIVHKTKMNTKAGQESQGETWDFVKGGVEDEDRDVEASIRRELLEETGSVKYKLMKRFDESITFEFPAEVQCKIGYHNQVIPMFHYEYEGDEQDLSPLDKEIDQLRFVGEKELLLMLKHPETQEFIKQANFERKNSKDFKKEV
ncbi:NUDIX hydrolase [Anaerobacillus sp. 1_MG-2023]|uniref:NUDIX hydrolase n=1 Tax=Anaerobacillus sp. 1_MG-2023 TaxID=3062655 RepID=UPI0026E3FDC7|nr:NUDIX hydrolase [Anaerobacillus sp. 1_MG-2023]MDO6655251.1 NUDIX hydrolase [Anaerobacillus sp. 1_MG-2023]